MTPCSEADAPLAPNRVATAPEKAVPATASRIDSTAPSRTVRENTALVSSLSPFPMARVHIAVHPTMRMPVRIDATLKYVVPIPQAASAVGPKKRPVMIPSMIAVTAPESSATTMVTMAFWNSVLVMLPDAFG